MAIRTILFDLDGTLIDSEPLAAEALIEVLKEEGLVLDATDGEKVVGRKWEVVFEWLRSRFQYRRSPELVEKDILRRYRSKIERHLPMVPGAREAIQKLSKQFSLALVSGSHRSDIEFALKKIQVNTYFSVVLGAEDYPRSKPEPDGFLKALELLKCQPSEAIVFEDSLAGILSGNRAGIPVVAIECTNRFAQDQSGARLRIADWQGVDPAWIHRHFP